MKGEKDEERDEKVIDILLYIPERFILSRFDIDFLLR